MSQVNPAILRWARERAGLTRAEAAKKIKLKDTATATATERLASLEAGSEEPGRSLVLRMAKQYRRPLLTFYMNEPPLAGDHGKDFRTLAAVSSPTEEAWLDALLRRIQGRHSVLKAIADPVAPFNGTGLLGVACSPRPNGGGQDST